MADQITGDLVERNSNGTFAKGHAKIGGRAKRSTEEAFLHAIYDGISTEDVREGAKKLARKLRNGDPVVWKLLLPYLAGLPIQRNEHTGQDGNPLKILVEYASNDSSEFGEPGNY